MNTPTIKDVAKYANVSTATVSRVINHKGSVKPANEKKVRDAIKACGFLPNFVARNLKSSYTRTIGYLVSDISNPYFITMAKAIEKILQQKNYNMLICSTEEKQSIEISYLQRFASDRVDGIILNATNKNDSYIAQLSRSIPIVLIERKILSPDFIGDFVGANNFSSVFQITQHLLNVGHRKIGIIGSELEVNTGQERMQGFIQAMAIANIPIDKNYPYQFTSSYFNYEGGFDGTRKLMTLSDPPTALIAVNNMLALGALSYLKTHNYSIPKDVSFCSYGNIENSELMFIDLSYSSLDLPTLGECAANFLISRIEKEINYNRQAIFEAQLIPGKSIAPPDQI